MADDDRSTSNAHHGLAPHEVVLLLGSDPQHGLSEEAARERLASYGPNQLADAPRDSVLVRIVRQFQNPLIYVLAASGAVTALLGQYVDSAVIVGVMVVNAFVGFVQESKAEVALDALRSMVHTTARVVRDAREVTVPSEELVPGDVVLVEAGDRVPADARLLRLAELQVDESALTGESSPVVKDQVLALPEETPVADRRNMVYSGTLVTVGTGMGIVVATGSDTELGEIHRLVGAARVPPTPLTEKLARFSRLLTVVILILAALTYAIGLARGEDAVQTFTAAVALAVGAIPEGLPAAVTITLAIGVGRMARRRAVIRRLPAVETLGSTTVVCSDKTGTLTENQMTVRALWTADGEFTVTGDGYDPEGAVETSEGIVVTAGTSEALRWCLVAGALCNDAALGRDDDRWTVLGDPTEGALLAVLPKAGLDRDATAAEHRRVATMPFSSERGYMATLHQRLDTGQHLVVVKGAVERVADLCSGELGTLGEVRPVDHLTVHQAADDLAGHGLRVLAMAVAWDVDPERFEEIATGGSMVLAGLQAMHDPPRAAAAAAVRACHTAGITVKLITGDHAATATAIADRLGLFRQGPDDTGPRVLTGADLAALPADEYADAVDRVDVFARVSPEQKLRLVEALQDRGHVVAMTGDGVNDAPALRQADIGVAMGRGGTDVAKEAADMVLTDDDFATIEAAVEEGRGVFDNLTKFIVWTLPTNMGEGFVILVAILLGTALPILPTQILWINMTTAVALGLMLAFEPKEAGIMNRPPRAPDRPLLTADLITRVMLVSALLVGGSWWLFQWEQNHGATLTEARTAALNLFVVVELFYLFSCRSLTHSMWRIGVFSNPWVVGGVTVQALGQAALTYLPVMNDLFHTTPIDARAWLRIVLVASIAAVVVAVDKSVRSRRL
ncbi:MAG TPA: HAD-IC family P-type ATPase [Marmoricola sp.]|nr:HAD-IC family P-type ATPase [Marmoricola sp.]